MGWFSPGHSANIEENCLRIVENPEKSNGVTHCHAGPREEIARREFTYLPVVQTGLHILHFDDDILVLNKPSGLLSVPGKDPENFDCVEHRSRKQFVQARIVHRLDMATSGLMVMALNASAHRHLGLQFERRHVKKEYLARVGGNVRWPKGVISLPMRCDWPNRPVQMVDYQHGRQAETTFEVISRDGETSLLRLFPETGRSHQLRLHLAELGHPILGDSFYADDKFWKKSARLLLHACRISFHHPCGGRMMMFESDVDFREAG